MRLVEMVVFQTDSFWIDFTQEAACLKRIQIELSVSCFLYTWFVSQLYIVVQKMWWGRDSSKPVHNRFFFPFLILCLFIPACNSKIVPPLLEWCLACIKMTLLQQNSYRFPIRQNQYLNLFRLLSGIQTGNVLKKNIYCFSLFLKQTLLLVQ